MVHKDNDQKTDLEIRRVMEQLGLTNMDIIRFFKAIQEKYDREKSLSKEGVTGEGKHNADANRK